MVMEGVISKVKITPEMIQAGMRVIFECDGIVEGVGFFSHQDLAMKVYEAMEHRRISTGESS